MSLQPLSSPTPIPSDRRKPSPISPADSEAVRDLQAEFLVEALVSAKSISSIEQTLAGIRQSLGEAGGFSLAQVRAASAYFRIWGNEAIAEYNTTHQHSPVIGLDALVVAGAHYLGVAGPASAGRLKLVAQHFGSDAEVLSALASLYRERVERYRTGNRLPSILGCLNFPAHSQMSQPESLEPRLPENSLPPLVVADVAINNQSRLEAPETQPLEELSLAPAQRPEPEEPKASRWREWEVSYNNPQKEAWRQTWASFIERNLSQEQRKKAVVLCMPSIQAELEVGHYLRLGINPSNIFAVDHATGEGGVKFEEACKSLGVNCFRGTLQSFLDTDYPRLTIVNFDFHGQLCASSLRLLERLRLAQEAIVLTNFLGARESEDANDLLTRYTFMGTETYARVHEIQSLAIAHPHTLPFEDARVEGLEHKLVSWESNWFFEQQEIDSTPISVRRISGLPLAIWRHLGRDHWRPLWEPAATWLGQFANGEDRQAEASFLTSIAGGLGVATDKAIGATTREGSLKYIFFPLMTEVLIKDPIVRAAERWHYLSKTGRGGAPYESTFLRISFDDEISGRGVSKIRDLCWATAVAVRNRLALQSSTKSPMTHSSHRLREYLDNAPEIEVHVSTGDRFRLPLDRVRHKSDILTVKVCGETIDSITARDLLRARLFQQEYFDKFQPGSRLLFREMQNLQIREVPEFPQ